MTIVGRLLASSGSSAFGSWLTFLGIALFVQENYGSEHVPFTFIVQSVPPLLASRRLARAIPTDMRHGVFVALQFAATALLLPLIAAPSLTTIYLFLIGSSITKAIANPLLNSLIGDWVEKDKLQSAYTRVAGVNAGTFALAPALGGVIAENLGYQALFALDAVSYLTAAAFLVTSPPMTRRLVAALPAPQAGFAFRIPSELKGAAGFPMIAWLYYTLVGVFLTGVEFLLFDFNALTKLQIGIAISAWGAANVAALLIAERPFVRAASGWKLSAAYAFGIAMFASGNGVASASAGFFVAGFCSAILTGSLRAAIQRALPEEADSLPTWLWCNQMTAALNILVYTMIGLAIMELPSASLGIALIALSGAFAVLMFAARRRI